MTASAGPFDTRERAPGNDLGAPSGDNAAELVDSRVTGLVLEVVCEPAGAIAGEAGASDLADAAEGSLVRAPRRAAESTNTRPEIPAAATTISIYGTAASGPGPSFHPPAIQERENPSKNAKIRRTTPGYAGTLPRLLHQHRIPPMGKRPCSGAGARPDKFL